MLNFFVAIIFPILAFGPAKSIKTNEFVQVDEYARKVRKSRNFELTAEKLVAPYSSEKEKARAIFIWITEHVKYDVKRVSGNYRGGKKTRISANSPAELAKIKKQRQLDKANIAFKKGKGVCENYAYLFKFMANHVGLEAELVSGNGRNNPNEIGRQPKISNHAWNSVKIDGQWYLLDATWAAGNTNPAEGKFTKVYKEGYFMADPYFFITTHYPDDPKWQLLPDPVNDQEYAALPLGHHELSSGGFLDYFPKTGLLKNSSDGITLSLVAKDRNVNLLLLDNRRITPVKALREGNKFTFHIKSKRLRGHELSIIRKDGEKSLPIISYKVI